MAFYKLEDGSLAYWPDGQTPPWQQKYTPAQDPNAPGVSDSYIKNTLGGGFDGFSSPTGNYTGAMTGQAFDNSQFGQGPEFYSNLQDWRNQNSGAGFGAGSDWWRYYQENPMAAYNDLGDPSLYQWQNGIPYYQGSDGQWHAKNVASGSGRQRDYFSNAPAYDPTKGSEYTGQDSDFYKGLATKSGQALTDANNRLNGGIGSGGSTVNPTIQNPMQGNNWWKNNGLNQNYKWDSMQFGGGNGQGGWQPDGTFNPSGGASIYQGFNGQAGNGGAWQNSPIDFVAANQSYQLARKNGQISPYYGASGWQGNNNNYSGSNYGNTNSPFATMQNNQKNNAWFQGLNTTQQIEAMKRANALKAQDVYAGKGLQGGYFKTVQDTWGQ